MDPRLERVRWYNWACRGAGPLVGRSLRNSNQEIWTLRRELEALRPLLPEIRCPVSFLHGTHDRLAPLANVDYSMRLLKGSVRVRRVDLPRVGHFVPWQRHDALVEELVLLSRRGHPDSALGSREAVETDPSIVTQMLPRLQMPVGP